MFSDCSVNQFLSDEVIKAQTAKPIEDTIFGKIERNEIPVDLLHDDDQVLSSFLIIRKKFEIILNLVCSIS